MSAAIGERVAVATLAAGDLVVLPLPEGDEICEIRRVLRPGTSEVVLVDFRLANGATGTCNLLSGDAVLLVRRNPARRAA